MPEMGPGRIRPRHVDNHALDTMAVHMSRQVEDEYGEDIIAYMDSLENATVPDAYMMDLQPEIEWHMRPYLLDFLIDTHAALRLQPHTLFLAVNLVDRYCSKRVVYRKHYQLVGCTALWIAAKYEDKKSRVPTINDLRNMCCKAYEGDMFIQMEGHVLNTLEWSVGHPTVESYLQLHLRVDGYSPTLRHVAQYLCEISMYHRAFTSMLPSTVAAAAYTLAQHILSNDHIAAPSQLNSQELTCLNLLCQHMTAPSKSLLRKFSSSTLSQAAHLVSAFVARQHRASISTPMTPPPSAVKVFTPPALSSSSSSLSASPRDDSSPIYAAIGKPDLHVKISAPFAKSEGYITPPCTPDEFNLPTGMPHPPAIFSHPHVDAYGRPKPFSVAMEYSQSMET